MLQNIKLEQGILACMLIDRDCAMDYGLLDESDFVSTANKEIFNSIKRLIQKDKQVDYMTVYQDLNQEIPLTTLTTLSESMPTVRNFQQYINQLKDISLKRNLYKLAEQMKDKDKTGKEIAEVAEKEILNLMESSISGDFTQAKDVVLEALDRIQKTYYEEEKSGLPTGYKAIDSILRGLRKGDYILLAARPSMGKTALAMNMAENIAFNNKTVAFFSLEMTEEELMQRMVMSSSLVSNQKLATKKMTDHDWDKISRATSAILGTNLFIDDDASRTVPEMQSMCRRLKRKKGLDLVIIDYLQYVQSSINSSRREQIEQVSRDLKRMAKELDVPVIVISSLSRKNEMREDKRPILSDLRETGQIEFDADVVIFIHRDEYYNPDTERKGIAEIIVAKHRKGPIGIAELGFIPELTKFVDIEKLERRY